MVSGTGPIMKVKPTPEKEKSVMRCLSSGRVMVFEKPMRSCGLASK